jgi:hypothetical protein
VADDILLETREPIEAAVEAAVNEPIEEPEDFAEPDADTQEVPVLVVAPPPLDDEPIRAHRVERFERSEPIQEAQQTFEGVTPSADWGFDDPEDFSAPI